MFDFICQVLCGHVVIFRIRVIALVFVSCGWSVNWMKTLLDPTKTHIYLGFLWNTIERNIAIPEEKTTTFDNWTKLLIARGSTNQLPG